MTCIAAIVDSGKVWMGGDSLAAAGWECTSLANPKVFIRGEFLFGSCGEVRFGQLLQWSLVLPAPHESQDLFGFMCTDFITAIRDCFKAGGWAEKDKEKEKGGDFLVGFRGRIFEIESNYQIIEHTNPYACCGSGQAYACGSLYSTRDNKHSPEKRIRMALEAAEHHNMGVRGPFTILSL